MKLPFLTFLLLIGATTCWGQTNLSKPTIGKVLSGETLSPGTIKAQVIPLNLEWSDASCQQEMEQISIKIEHVIAVGNSLVNPPGQGDSLNIRILPGMDFTKNALKEKDTLLLKEQLCSFDQTYYTLIRKE